jgi:NADPH:quinone reductase-like Zn-dependent oxidoreductase
MARFTMALNSVLVLLCLGVLNGADAFQNSKLRASPLDVLSVTGDRTRRDLLEAGGVALSSLVLGQALPAFAQGSDPQTIVITGANSGIGFDACKRLAQQGHTLVLACRTMEKSVATADRLKDLGGTMIPAECDLASLASIKEFADKLPNLVGNKKLDCLCLSAGLARNTAATDVARTADGFELTGKSLKGPRSHVRIHISLTLQST